MQRENIKSPTIVSWLGWGGLVPFVGLTALYILDPAHAGLWGTTLLNYSAVILSFVGALHWAFATTQRSLSQAKRMECFVWSVVPALIGWVALSLPAAAATFGLSISLAVPLVLIIAGFATHYLQDLRVAGAAALPTWYLPLRARLTVVACSCAVLCAAYALI